MLTHCYCVKKRYVALYCAIRTQISVNQIINVVKNEKNSLSRGLVEEK